MPASRRTARRGESLWASRAGGGRRPRLHRGDVRRQRRIVDAAQYRRPLDLLGGEAAGTSDVEVVGLSGQQGHEHGVDFGVGVDAVGEECQVAKKGTCGDADGVRVTVGGDLHVVGR